MDSGARRRFVLDTNTLASAYLFPNSSPGKALDFVLGHAVLLMSLAVASEVADVLRREKFDRYLTLRRREELVASTIRDSEFIEPVSRLTDCRDPNDNKFLELAVDGTSAAIVSGDADLLSLHPFRGIPILTASDFLVQFAGDA